MVSIRSFIPPSLQAFALIASAFAIPTSRSTSAPLVSLDYGTFQGFSSDGGTESFLGMQFAAPPLGQLRFNKPVPPQSFSGVREATHFGDACPQQPLISRNESFPDNPGLDGALPYIEMLIPRSTVNSSEDCLYINVIRPSGARAGYNHPVIVWIYGGAFEFGDASEYDGTRVVSRSIDLKSPVIYVSLNYRLSAFGFMGGREIEAAGLGNLGLLDQRLALQWVQKYIYSFGGNPQQVTAWGESAGATSVMLQMVANEGQLNGLFQGAVMQSGSTALAHDITSQQAQDNYDLVVQQTNCGAASDTLDCLRQAPYEAIQNAVLQTPTLLSHQGLNTSWKPLVDGSFLKQPVRKSLSQGKYAQVPAIFGSVDDEGTIFSLFSLDVVNEAQFADYMQKTFLVGTTEAEMNKVRKLYPKDPTLGSPYGTGTNDSLSPEYKRIASFLGDFYFHVPRRYTLRYLPRTQNVWGYQWKRDKFIPVIGSFHGSDLPEFFDSTNNSDWLGTDALVNFAHAFNPNAPVNGYPFGAAPSVLSEVYWPQYYHHSPQLLTLEDPRLLVLTNDTFRAKQIKFLNEIQDRLGL